MTDVNRISHLAFIVATGESVNVDLNRLLDFGECVIGRDWIVNVVQVVFGEKALIGARLALMMATDIVKARAHRVGEAALIGIVHIDKTMLSP